MVMVVFAELVVLETVSVLNVSVLELLSLVAEVASTDGVVRIVSTLL